MNRVVEPMTASEWQASVDTCMCGDYRKHHDFITKKCLICRAGIGSADHCEKFELHDPVPNVIRLVPGLFGPADDEGPTWALILVLLVFVVVLVVFW